MRNTLTPRTFTLIDKHINYNYIEYFIISNARVDYLSYYKSDVSTACKDVQLSGKISLNLPNVNICWRKPGQSHIGTELTYT